MGEVVCIPQRLRTTWLHNECRQLIKCAIKAPADLSKEEYALGSWALPEAHTHIFAFFPIYRMKNTRTAICKFYKINKIIKDQANFFFLSITKRNYKAFAWSPRLLREEVGFQLWHGVLLKDWLEASREEAWGKVTSSVTSNASKRRGAYNQARLHWATPCQPGADTPSQASSDSSSHSVPSQWH